MTFQISFPDQPAAEAGILAQELRLALLRSGAIPGKLTIIKERADTMDVGSVIQIALDAYYASGPMLEHVMPALTALHCARCLYDLTRHHRTAEIRWLANGWGFWFEFMALISSSMAVLRLSASLKVLCAR